jgi:hypothetical protein
VIPLVRKSVRHAKYTSVSQGKQIAVSEIWARHVIRRLSLTELKGERHETAEKRVKKGNH